MCVCALYFKKQNSKEKPGELIRPIFHIFYGKLIGGIRNSQINRGNMCHPHRTSQSLYCVNVHNKSAMFRAPEINHYLTVVALF